MIVCAYETSYGPESYEDHWLCCLCASDMEDKGYTLKKIREIHEHCEHCGKDYIDFEIEQEQDRRLGIRQ